MQKFNSILKVQLLSYYGINKILHSKKRGLFTGLFGLIAMALSIGGAIIYMGYTYSDMFINQLYLTGESDKLIPLMIAFGSLAALLYSFYSVINVLYGYNDYLLIGTLPVKTNVVVISKLILTYVGDVLFSLLILGPALYVYFNYGGNLTTYNIISLVVMAITCPLFALSISVFIGMVVAFISSRFRKKALIQTLLFVLIMVGIGFLSAYNTQEGNAFKTITQVFFIYPLVEKAIYDPTILAILVGGLIAATVIANVFVCVTYKGFYNILSAKKKSKKFKFKEVKKEGQFKSLLKKEFKRLFSSSTYMLNTLLGPIMMLIMGVVLFIVLISSEGWVLGLLAGLSLPGIPIIFIFSLLTSPTTNCSLSMEGQAFWVVRTAPIKFKTLISAKILVSIIINVIATVVFSGLMWYAIGFGTDKISISSEMSFGLTEGFLFVACGLLCCVLSAGSGMLFNLLFPHLKWDSEVKAVKQGLSVLMEVLFSLALLGGTIYLVSIENLNYAYKYLIVDSALAVLSVIVYFIVYTFGDKILRKKGI